MGVEPILTEEGKRMLIGHLDSLDSKLKALMNPHYPYSIPSLLDKVPEIIGKKGYYPNLTDFYPETLQYDGTKKFFEVSFSFEEDGICLQAFDPSSDTVDSGDSHTKKVTREEFLKWVKKDLIRILDVYKHLVSFIESPAIQKEECQRDLYS